MNQADRFTTAHAAPGVTVVIPCWNQARFVRDAAVSALQQVPPPLEVRVIDDGSTDDPAGALAGLDGVTLVRTANCGRSAARNRGLAQARGDYVVFLDADDMLAPGALAAQLACFAQHPQAGFVYGAFRMVDVEGAPVGDVHYWPAGRDTLAGLLDRNRPNLPAAVMFHRVRLCEAGGFAEDMDRAEDYEAYLRTARLHGAASHPRVVALYRRHDGNSSADFDGLLRGHLEALARNLPPGDERLVRARSNAHHAYAERAWAERGQDRTESLRRLGKLMKEAPMATLAGTLRHGLLAAMPAGLKRRLKHGLRARHMARGRRVDFGQLARATPLDGYFGMDRGTAVDRPYIAQFMARHAAAITGCVLEVGDARYASQFGQGVSRIDVLNLLPGEAETTIVGDLADPLCLPAGRFDCIIAAQTLQYVSDPAAVLANCHAALAPGGTLLLTVPALSPAIDEAWPWRWLFARGGLEALLAGSFDAAQTQVECFGNCYAAACFIYGVAAEEADPALLAPVDPARPVVICAAARKAG